MSDVAGRGRIARDVTIDEEEEEDDDDDDKEESRLDVNEDDDLAVADDGVRFSLSSSS